MPIVWLKLPDTRKKANGRPHSCPYCGNSILQRWGQVSKPVRDAQENLAVIYRYRCVVCERTFRHYPEGVDRSDQSLRIRQVAGLAWAMGMSTREVVDAFDKAGLNVSRTSVWREGKRLAERLDSQANSYNGKKYAIDRNYIHRISTRLGVVVALDIEGNGSVILGTLDEYNPMKVKSWVESLIENLEVDVSVLGTGTLDGYCTTDPGISLATYM